MDNEILTYIMAGTAGCVAGLVRFLKSPKQWKARTIAASSLFGGMLSVIAIGLWLGSEVDGRRWVILAISLVIGFAQPEFIISLEFLRAALAAAGIKVVWLQPKNGGQDKGDGP